MPRLDVIAQLETEWEELRASQATTRMFEELREADPALVTIDDLDDLTATMAAREGPRDFDQHDEILLALLNCALVRTDAGDLAARIIVQLLLPGVKSLWDRSCVTRFETQERSGVLLAALYEEIRRPRSPWKPAKVGAQVLGRAYRRLRPPRGAAARVRIYPYGEADPTWLDRGTRTGDEQRHPSVELLEVLADAVHAGHITREKAHLIAAVRVAGEKVDCLAAQLGVSYDTLEHRLRRAEIELCRSLSKAA